MVIDGFGLGAFPDALNVSMELYEKIIKSAKLPTFTKLGIQNLNNSKSRFTPMASYGYLKSMSSGSDIVTLYFELSGLHIKTTYPTYPKGLPETLLKELETALDTHLIGNIVVEGKRLINDLGALHYNTAYPIIYTSSSSIMYICAHEEILPLNKLYDMCKMARKVMQGKHNIARVMASPFNGKINDFKFTDNNKCFTVLPPAPTMLDVLELKGIDVTGIGKIGGIFNGQGIKNRIDTKTNDESFNEIVKILKSDSDGMIFANLETADLSRNDDLRVYIKSVEDIDNHLSEIIPLLSPDDLLILTSNHSFETSETTAKQGYVIPMIIYGGRIKPSINLNTKDGLYSVAHTVLDYFNINGMKKSFLNEVIK